MKKFFVCAVVFFALISCKNNITYKVRPLGEGSMIIEQERITGLKTGDTVQLDRDVSYPYHYRIDQHSPERSDTVYIMQYKTSDGDTAGMVISKKVAIIEEIYR